MSELNKPLGVLLSLVVQKHTLSYCRTFSFRSQNTDVLLFGVQLLVTNAPFCLQLISALFCVTLNEIYRESHYHQCYAQVVKHISVTKVV